MAEKVLLSLWVRFFLLPLGTFICALTPNEWRSQGFSLWQEKVPLCIYPYSNLPCTFSTILVSYWRSKKRCGNSVAQFQGYPTGQQIHNVIFFSPLWYIIIKEVDII